MKANVTYVSSKDMKITEKQYKILEDKLKESTMGIYIQCFEEIGILDPFPDEKHNDFCIAFEPPKIATDLVYKQKKY